MRVAKVNHYWYMLLDDGDTLRYNTVKQQLVLTYIKERHFKRLEVTIESVPDNVYLVFIEALLGE